MRDVDVCGYRSVHSISPISPSPSLLTLSSTICSSVNPPISSKYLATSPPSPPFSYMGCLSSGQDGPEDGAGERCSLIHVSDKDPRHAPAKRPSRLYAAGHKWSTRRTSEYNSGRGGRLAFGSLFGLGHVPQLVRVRRDHVELVEDPGGWHNVSHCTPPAIAGGQPVGGIELELDSDGDSDPPPA